MLPLHVAGFALERGRKNHVSVSFRQHVCAAEDPTNYPWHDLFDLNDSTVSFIMDLVAKVFGH